MTRKIDAGISVWSEGVARRLTRRSLLSRTVRRTVAIVGALALKDLAFAKAAMAACTCTNIGVGACSVLGLTCPTDGGCPMNCYLCKTGDKMQAACNAAGCNTCPCSGCNHSSGQWTVCTCGTCGMGFHICSDCRCCGCSQKCTCNSGCICASCCRPQDVQAALAEHGLALAGAR